MKRDIQQKDPQYKIVATGHDPSIPSKISSWYQIYCIPSYQTVKL